MASRQEHESTREQVAALALEMEELKQLTERYRIEAAQLRSALALSIQRRARPDGDDGEGDLTAGFDDALYYAFEEEFRGPREVIKQRVTHYLPTVKVAYETCQAPILDVGCGRGEFLELCRDAGWDARGVDISPAMVACCQRHGISVCRENGLTYAARLADNSLSVVSSLQRVEHLDFPVLWEFVQLALLKLRPGGLFLLETVNAENFATLRNFYLDPGHKSPIPHATLAFLLRSAGFRNVAVHFSSMIPASEQLQGTDRDTVVANRMLFGAQDYSVQG